MSSLSAISNDVTLINNSRACNVSYTSLQHSRSLSKTRLNKSLDNICNLGKPPARCALHRWLGYETEKDLQYCSSCNVNLCVRCNRIFHTVTDIISMRDPIKKRYKTKDKLNNVLRLTKSNNLCYSHVLLHYYIIINVKSGLFLLIF